VALMFPSLILVSSLLFLLSAGQPVERLKRQGTPVELLAHFIASSYSLQMASQMMEGPIEAQFASLGLDGVGFHDVLDDVPASIDCAGGSQCFLDMPFLFTVTSPLTPSQQNAVCTGMVYFLTNKSNTIGGYECDITLGLDGYTADIMYNETYVDEYKSNLEAEFVYHLWEMLALSGNLSTTMEYKFQSWNLTTHNADIIMRYFFRDYRCDDAVCEFPLRLSFSVANPVVFNSTSNANQDSICDGIATYFTLEVGLTGTWYDCSVVTRPYGTVDPGRAYAIVLYSEGGGGLSGGAIAAIVILCILAFILLVVLLVVGLSTSRNTEKESPDYV